MGLKPYLHTEFDEGSDQYLVCWRGYDSSKDSWLSETELEHS